MITPIRRFFNLLKVEKQEILSIYVYALFHGIVTLSLPLGIQAIINLISGGQVSTSWILLVILVIVGIGLTGAMQIMQLSISENLQQKIFTRSAFEFAYRIPRMKLEAVDTFHMPEVVNRFFDTLSVQKGLSKILMDFSSASLQVVFGLLLLSFYHPFFILFSIVLIVIAYFIFKFTAPKGLKTSLVESKYKYKVAHWLEELARSMEIFKLAGSTSLPMEKTDEVVQGYLASRKNHFKVLVVQYINLIGFKVIVAAGLLLIGGLLVINQQMNIGQFVASEIIIILVLASVEKLIVSMETIYDVLTAIEKIGYVTDIPLDRDEGTTASLTDGEGIAVSLHDFSYRFDGDRNSVLKNINLNISQGEKLCLSGPNGSGKSFFVRSMAGLYDQFSGSISYNGIPLGNWDKKELYALIGDSLAKEDIFEGTLLENISLGRPDVSMERIHQLTTHVGLSDFVESQVEGYDTKLIPEGKNLPKSVRLKIILARSLAASPRLLLLEEGFNQLNKTDLDRFLNYVLDQNCTVLAVSNNPEIARRFDRTLVIDNGELVGYGEIDAIRQQTWYKKVFNGS